MFDALGQGYVSFVNGLVQAGYPAHGIRVVNMGISGNTVRDLQGRWQSDVVDLQPDWVSICIGINDVWRHFDTPLQPEGQVSLEEYSRTLESLIRTTRPTLKGLILMTPYIIESSRADGMRAMMDDYGAVVRHLAATYAALLVDTQAAFDTVLQYLQPMALSWDRVHPTQTGHFILTRAFLQAIGYEW